MVRLRLYPAPAFGNSSTSYQRYQLKSGLGILFPSEPAPVAIDTTALGELQKSKSL